LGQPTSWLWDFGDNTTSIEENPVHTYNLAGVYTVTLTCYRGLLEETKTKEEYIKINFVDSVTKYAYIFLYPVLATEDIAPPLDRLDLRTMYARGSANYLFIREGIRVLIPKHGLEEGSGFFRRQGPSLIFD
jgi:hypothetical protein